MKLSYIRLCLSALAILCVAVPAFPLTNGTWEYFTNDFMGKPDNIIITKYISTDNIVEVIIPREIDGKTVTDIRYDIFSGNKNVLKVFIPDTVVSIACNIFSNSVVKEIAIPDTLKEIKYSEQLQLPKSVEKFVIYKSTNGIIPLESRLLYKSNTKLLLENNSIKQIVMPKDMIPNIYRLFQRDTAAISVLDEDGKEYLHDGLLVDDDGCLLFCSKKEPEIVIPEVVNGITVTSTAPYIFYDKNYRSISLPDTIKTIGDYAFSESSITNIQLPSNITKIPRNAFYGCYKLESISIPDSVVEIANRAFYGTKFKSIVLPDNLKIIGSEAFDDSCLENIIIPSSVTKIGKNAFTYNKLTSIVIPQIFAADLNDIFGQEVAAKIKIYDENGVHLNKTLIVKDGVLVAVYYDGKILVIPSVVDGEKITSIGSRAAENNKFLEQVFIYEGIEKIGDSAFNWCENLSNVELPDTLKTIGKGSFQYCTKLKEIIFPKNLTTIGNYAFSSCRLTSLEIPMSVMNIGSSAFYNNSITQLIIPARVLSKEQNSSIFSTPNSTRPNIFYIKEITLLDDNGNKTTTYFFVEDGVITTIITFDEELIIPSTINGQKITTIGKRAVDSNRNIKKIIIGKGIKTIEDEAFYSCTNIEEVILPDSLVSIGKMSFSNSKKSKIVIPRKFQNEMVNIFGRNIYNEENKVAIYDEKGKMIYDSIKQSDGFSVFIGEIVSVSKDVTGPDIIIPANIAGNKVTGIGDNLFNRNRLITNVKIEKGIERIGEYAFWECSNLQSVELPNTLKIIEKYAFGRYGFGGNSGIEEIVLPKSLKEVGTNAFIDCKNLKKITVPSHLLGDLGRIFNGCTNITTIVDDKGKSVVKDGFVVYKGMITYYVGEGGDLVIPEKIGGQTIVGVAEKAFYSKQNIKSVTLPKTLKTIGRDAFYGCSLESINLPTNLKTIEQGAFFLCNDLKEVIIPHNVTVIPDYAFAYCVKLEKVVALGELQSVASNAFYLSDALKEKPPTDVNETPKINLPNDNPRGF